MKKTYIAPEMCIVILPLIDTLTTSSTDDTAGGGGSGETDFDIDTSVEKYGE